MTDAGNQLFTQAGAKGLGVVIDHMVISDKKAQAELSQLDSSFFDLNLPINARDIVGNASQFEVVIYNTNFQTDYAINLVGLTGHMSGVDESVLVAVAAADEPIVIPAASDVPYTQYVDFSITNDKATNITAEINTAGLVSNDTFDKTLSSLNNAASNYATNSMLTSYATTNSLASYATTSQLSSAMDSIPSSFNVDSLSGFATISNVSAQITGAESYANSVAVSAAIGSTNWVNTIASGTDLNTVVGVGRYVLLPNGNYNNFPAGLDATQQAYMDVIPDVYGNASQHLMGGGNDVEAIRFKQPNGWVNWSITATLNDTNNAYQNAVNTASAYANTILSSAQSYAQSLINSYQSSFANFQASGWIPSGAVMLPFGTDISYPPAQNTWYYIAPNTLSNYRGLPTGKFALSNTIYYAVYNNNGIVNFKGINYTNSQVYVFSYLGPATETFPGGSQYWSNNF